MSRTTSTLHTVRTTLRQAWQQRSPREQQLLGLATAVLALAALWQVALAPAWHTWQEAPNRQARLDAQTQRMLELQAQAKSLQKPLAISRAEAMQWLESSLAELGTGAKIQRQGEQLQLSVEAAPADKMAHWLSQARLRAQALPLQAQLQQIPEPGKPARPTATPPSANSANTSAADKTSTVYWRGTLLLRLPGNP